MKGSRTKALLVFTFQCYIIYTFPADGSLHCQSDSIWTNLNDYLGSIILTIVILRHLGILTRARPGVWATFARPGGGGTYVPPGYLENYATHRQAEKALDRSYKL